MARLGRQYLVGERLWENDINSNKLSAGRIVAIVEPPERPERLYMLLRANDGTETIYTCLKNLQCNPGLPRYMPRGVVFELGELASQCDLTPDDVDESPVPKERKKSPPPQRKFYVPPPDEDLSDIDEELDEEFDEELEEPSPVFGSGEESETVSCGRILPVVDLPRIP